MQIPQQTEEYWTSHVNT